MEKVWLNSYQPNVPTEINLNRYDSLNSLFAEACQKFNHLPALSFYNVAFSYRTWYGWSLQLAVYLQKKLHLQKGDKVGLMLPNCPQFMVAMFAVLQAGLTIININPLYSSRELVQQIKHSEATAIIGLKDFLVNFQPYLKQTNIKHVISCRFGDLLPWPKSWLVNTLVYLKGKNKKKASFPSNINFLNILKAELDTHLSPVNIQIEDIAILQYTGGTSGSPKAAMLTHRNLLANTEQLTAWVRPVLREGQETMITMLPLYHIFSLTVNGLMGLRLGAKNVLVPDARKTRQLITLLNKERFSVLLGVNTLFKSLLLQNEFKNLDFSSLKIALGGGAPIQEKVKQHWKEVTGKLLLEGYGLTEASPVVCAPPWDLTEVGKHVGLPLPSTDVCVRDKKGKVVALGQVGELCVKGPQVMRSYWRGCGDVTMGLDDNGWLLTGDLVYINKQGFVFIVGRKKELILVSGFNVYPAEVESVIQSHAKVSETAVLGRPSEKTGECIEAFVVRNDSTLTKWALLAYCHRYLASYKVPTYITFINQLPKSSLGKILKKKLSGIHRTTD